MYNEPGQLHIHKRKGGDSLIPRCFTCSKFIYLGYGNGGLCKKLDLPCDGFRYCASHDKIDGFRLLKHKVESKSELESQDKPQIEHMPDRPQNIVHDNTDINSSMNEETTLCMKILKSQKVIKIDSFDTLMTGWNISEKQAIESAEYGNEIKGKIFFFRKRLKGIVVMKPDGSSVLYKDKKDVSYYEGISPKTLNKYLCNNDTDKQGRSFVYKMYEEDVPYKKKSL